MLGNKYLLKRIQENFKKSNNKQIDQTAWRKRLSEINLTKTLKKIEQQTSMSKIYREDNCEWLMKMNVQNLAMKLTEEAIEFNYSI